MSIEKDLKEFPNTPENKILPGADELPMLSTSPEMLELNAPEETLLLTSEHSTLVDAPATMPNEESAITPMPTHEEDSAEAILDPSIFDTVGTENAISITTETTKELEPSLGNSTMDTAPESVPSINSVTPPSEATANVSPIIQSDKEASIMTNQVAQVEAPASNTMRIIIGIIALLAASGLLGWYVLSQNGSHTEVDIAYTISSEIATPTYESTILETVQSDQNDIELMNRAKSENNSAICDIIISESRKIECRESLTALTITASGTLEDCQTLTLATIRNNCTSAVVQSTAMSTLDKSLCSQLTDTAQSEYCRELVDQKVLVSMVSSNTVSESSCATLWEKYKAECMDSIKQVDDSTLLQKATSEEDLDTCKLLSTEEFQFACFDTILLKQALKSGDKNLCDYVRDETKKNTCISYMSKQDDTTLFKTAIVEKNLTMCSKVTTVALGNRCHDSVTLLIVRDTKDTTLCDTLIATGSIASCKASVQAN